MLPASRWIWLLLPPLLVGCAGMPGLKPAARVEIREPDGLRPEANGNDREVFIRQPFEGGLKTCGMQKNSAHLDVGTVECATNPADTLAVLLAGQLRKAGFQVQTDPDQPKPSTLQIRGVMMKFFLEPVGSQGYETDVQLRLTARSDTGLEAERIFYEKGRSMDAQRSVNGAVRKVLETMTNSIMELMNDYPMLGKGGTAARAPSPSSGPTP